MHRRHVADERRSIRKSQAGARVGFFALRAFVICGLLSGSVVAAMLAISAKSDEPAVAPTRDTPRVIPILFTPSPKRKPGRDGIEIPLDEDFSVDEAAA